jgi:hypothetical protein
MWPWTLRRCIEDLHYFKHQIRFTHVMLAGKEYGQGETGRCWHLSEQTEAFRIYKWSPHTIRTVRTSYRALRAPSLIYTGAGSSVIIETMIRVALWIGVRFPSAELPSSLPHFVQKYPEAHSASYPMGTRGHFPGAKAAGPCSWSLSSTYECWG